MTTTMNSASGNSEGKAVHHGKTLNLTLKVWRQEGPSANGTFETYEAKNISEDSSFLEMLDIVNERLNDESKTPITFDHDCREGICGTCSLMINGVPHGPERNTATCQLHMRKFSDGQTVTIEPWRATAFPLIKDLMVDRSAFDRIVESGGYITVAAGGAPDGNLIPIPKPVADAAMDAAACIGCGACVAACPNGSASLFTAAKVAHLNLLPQGQSERYKRTEAMVETMESYFGSCTNHGECQEACPKGISIDNIAIMNKDYLKSKFKNRRYLSRS
jgi:succinate dehydrogenase / fumarate reductase, iron-sulfur subunit